MRGRKRIEVLKYIAALTPLQAVIFNENLHGATSTEITVDMGFKKRLNVYTLLNGLRRAGLIVRTNRFRGKGPSPAEIWIATNPGLAMVARMGPVWPTPQFPQCRDYITEGLEGDSPL